MPLNSLSTFFSIGSRISFAYFLKAVSPYDHVETAFKKYAKEILDPIEKNVEREFNGLKVLTTPEYDPELQRARALQVFPGLSSKTIDHMLSGYNMYLILFLQGYIIGSDKGMGKRFAKNFSKDLRPEL